LLFINLTVPAETDAAKVSTSEFGQHKLLAAEWVLKMHNGKLSHATLSSNMIYACVASHYCSDAPQSSAHDSTYHLYMPQQTNLFRQFDVSCGNLDGSVHLTSWYPAKMPALRKQ
jgi:hypothetical protein